jgi:hypothetical protein
MKAFYTSSGTEIPTYDDGFGQLYIHRHSIGVSGIVRAQTWSDAYGIAEDEFFPEADETIDEIRATYGFKREHLKVIRGNTAASDYLAAGEKFAEPADYSDNGKLPDGLFIRWQTIETPAPDAWMENELFQEGFGFRNNGPNTRDKLNHGIYAKDLNGDSLDVLTPALAAELGITVDLEDDELVGQSS